MVKNLLLLVAFAIVLIGPVALRQKTAPAEKAGRTLVIVTPHNEAIRYEFARAFDAYYYRKHHQHVHIDWRMPGGTSEISRYLASEYLAAFENHWTHQLHRPWSAAVEGAFDNPKAPKDNSVAAQARKEFLDSNVSCGIDLFFGGGSFDFIQQAVAGRLVDSGVIPSHPDLFNDKAIPQNLGGEPYWDPEGRWIGVCLASFGICYNNDLLRLRKIEDAPEEWSDLADPRYFAELALANPTQSGSVAKAFEMLIQQQMLDCKVTDFEERKSTDSQGHQKDVSEITFESIRTGRKQVVLAAAGARGKDNTFQLGNDPNREMDIFTVPQGWKQAMQLILKISGNARYFTDSGTQVPFDVEAGNAAAGMCIDFYGRYESESARKLNGASRMGYVTPDGGSSFGADPIGMLRGAPNADLAKEFIEFTLSLDGQALWNWKVGAPSGPAKYALRRLPIRPELYLPMLNSYRSDPQVEPYEQANVFVYHDQWTSPYFRVISFIVRVMCIDPHDELRDAWQALIAAHFPPEATKTFLDVSKVDYAAATGPIRDTLRSPKRIDEMKLAASLSESFRAQYRKAAELARQGK